LTETAVEDGRVPAIRWRETGQVIASKGETYKLAAATKLRNFEELCIVVARP